MREALPGSSGHSATPRSARFGRGSGPWSWAEGGWEIEQSVELARRLALLDVDLVD